jgi:hypothetical protein
MEITKFVVSGRDKAKLYGDYATYRSQLSNRLHNLRKRLGIATKPRAKYTPKAPVRAEDIGRDHGQVDKLRKAFWKYMLTVRCQLRAPPPPHVRTSVGECHVHARGTFHGEEGNYRLHSIPYNIPPTQGYDVRERSLQTSER